MTLKGNQDFVFKSVTIFKEVINFESLNKSYQTYKEPIENVLEIWEYERFVSKELPNGTMDLQEIKLMIEELRYDIILSMNK